MVDWSIRYASEKEAFKIKFWERDNEWDKLLKKSPYQNLSDPSPSFTIIEPGYECSLCGTKKYPEDVFRDKSDRFYCKSHYTLPKVDTYNVRNQSGETVSKGKDTKEISRKVRQQAAEVYNIDKKRKEKEEKRKLKDFTKDTRPLDAIFASFKERYERE